MRQLTERGLDGLLLGLGAQLEASERRAEEEAANDLAFSLAQDVRAAEALCRSGAVEILRPGGSRGTVAAVGSDFLLVVGASQELWPLAGAVLIQSDRGRPPASAGLGFVEACRLLARNGATIELSCEIGPVEGRLELAARDFMTTATARGRVVTPYSAVRSIRVVRGGLTDAL
ncbi:MAG: hypothetical protein ACRDK3_05490 [Actinomycetota bacterium]